MPVIQRYGELEWDRLSGPTLGFDFKVSSVLSRICVCDETSHVDRRGAMQQKLLLVKDEAWRVKIYDTVSLPPFSEMMGRQPLRLTFFHPQGRPGKIPLPSAAILPERPRRHTHI